VNPTAMMKMTTRVRFRVSRMTAAWHESVLAGKREHLNPHQS
jgi:hypothetical protein